MKKLVRCNTQSSYSRMNVVNIQTSEEFDELYERNALTFEGVEYNKESLKQVYDWVEESGGGFVDGDIEIIVFDGKYMNEAYGLTKDNAYPDDLQFVSIPIEYLAKIGIMAIARLELGGFAKWFCDIVDNNADIEEGR